MWLDKLITQQLGVSRAIAGREIRSNRIIVDGKIVRSAAFKLLPEHDAIHDGNPLAQQHGPHYSILNKSQNYVCSTNDPDHLAVLYFLNEPVTWKLHAAGRLDIDTTGLALMTDDGQWLHRAASPCHHYEKTYLVTPESPATDDTAEQFAKGVQLHNEEDLIKPAVLKAITPTQVRLITNEGRYRQMRRMFAAVGSHVAELHHERVGGITPDADLAPGRYRSLTEEEIASVV